MELMERIGSLTGVNTNGNKISETNFNTASMAGQFFIQFKNVLSGGE